ncbi:hypothetical protein [Sulfurospirillum sp.]|uniref:hypothetical protein n=1 Tax=Sulfurospirillum sp. TaxID=2053622 RepID=UPI002FDEA968
MDFLKNISVNLHATGPATVMTVWCICITLLGLYGDGELANSAIKILSFFGGMVMIALANKA